MIGAVATPTFFLLVNGTLILLAAIPISLAIQFFWATTYSTATTLGLVISLAGFSLIGGIAGLFWWRRQHRVPVPIGAMWLSSPSRKPVIGNKARGLHLLLHHGLPIAQGWVLPTAALEHPGRAARRLLRLARSQGIERLVIRSSFGDEDGDRLFPGIFASVTRVDATDVAALEQAIRTVLASPRDEVVTRYYQRIGLDPPTTPGGGIVAQVHLSCEVSGVVSSQHMARRRPDLVCVEVTAATADASVDVYSTIHDRWLTEGTPLAPHQRGVLLDAVCVGEQIYEGPVVLEFGVHAGSVVLFQVRRAPSAPMLHIWSQSGPLALNPEPLPLLFSDVLYGEELGLLRDQVRSTVSQYWGASEERLPVEIIRKKHRLLARTSDLIDAMRHHPRPPSLGSTVLMLLRARPGKDPLAHNAAPGDQIQRIRTLAEAQGKVQQLSLIWRSISRGLEGLTGRSGTFFPLVPWHKAIVYLARGETRRLEQMRNRLHEDLVEKLEALAPAKGPKDWQHLRLREWRMCAEDAPSLPDAEEIAARARAYAEDLDTSLPPVLISEEEQPLALVDPTSQARESANSDVGMGSPVSPEAISLHPIYAGIASGRVVRAEDGDTKGCVVVLPDCSLRWRRNVMDAAAVLIVGGGEILSHLALLLIELEVPVLSGLTPAEAGALAGRTVRIKGHRVTVFDGP